MEVWAARSTQVRMGLEVVGVTQPSQKKWCSALQDGGEAGLFEESGLGAPLFDPGVALGLTAVNI